MLQSTKKITQKYRRQLKTEDFLILTQQNKEYQQIIKIMTEKTTILTNKISEMEKSMARLENQKEEFKVKFSHYEMIRQSLTQEYKLLRKQIQDKIISQKQKQRQRITADKKVAELEEANLSLELQIKKKDLIIEQLQSHISIKQKQILQNKIKIFTNLIELPPSGIDITSQGNKIKKKENSLLNSNVPSQTSSNNISKLNSISFSLQSNESQSKGKKLRNSTHNKSIFI